MANEKVGSPTSGIKKPPTGLAILAIVGPSLVWAAEYIGSGEVILATRTGAVLGTAVIWAIVLGIFLKYWIGMSGARYTVTTGEGMIDMFSRIPVAGYSIVWIVLIAQFAAAAISIASVANAAGLFISSMVPISPVLTGWIVTLFAVTVVWSGMFEPLKIVMSIFVAVVVIGVGYVAINVFPGFTEFLRGLIPSGAKVPEWAIAQGIPENPWREILPLLGWGAGGFASQVWYSYWIIGAGYGVAANSKFGQPADLDQLKSMDKEDGKKIKGWYKVVYTDATIAMLIGSVATVCFMLAGAGILGARQLAPDGPEVALTLSTILSSQWGKVGGLLFLLGGSAALLGTNVGQLAGWPRLLADATRICIPGFQKRFPWKTQFRIFLLIFVFTNMVIVYSLGFRPVFLVQLGAVLDGLLLTPLQAVCVGIGLFVVAPKLVNKEVRDFVRPHWIFAVGLAIAFLVFGYFCIFQLPYTL